MDNIQNMQGTSRFGRQGPESIQNASQATFKGGGGINARFGRGAQDSVQKTINSRFQPGPGQNSSVRASQASEGRFGSGPNTGAGAGPGDAPGIRPMGPMDQPVRNPGSDESTRPNDQFAANEAGKTPHTGPNYITSMPGDVKVEEAGAEQFDLQAVRHSLIGGQIKYSWERNKLSKQITDGRLLQCLRARKSVYSISEMAEIQRSGANSTIYMNVSSTKCAALASWMKEILLAPGDRPCGLEPRHLPQLPPEVREIIKQAASQRAQQIMVEAFQQGGPAMDRDSYRDLIFTISDQMEDDVKMATRRRARVAADKMEECVFQQMDDGNFDGSFAEFIEYFSTYPTAFLKGPYTKNSKQLKWIMPVGSSSEWKPMVETAPRLFWKPVSPFDVYPAPLARNCQDRDFIERLRLNYEELYECIGVDGYDEEAIRWACNQHQGGLLRNWIWTDAERARLENDTTFDWFCKDDLIDALHYWGAIEGRKLMNWGVKTNDPAGLDPERRYQVSAILIGTRVVYCTINDDPLGRRPYHHASFEEIPGSIWGRAVPELCASQQDACNAAARALINNMGIASGPQVGINSDRLPPNESITQMFPWKIWQFNKPETGQTGAAAVPIQFFQPQSIASELLQIYQAFMGDADDATGIPRYSYGDEKVAGAGATMGGLSMLMGAAARRIRRAINNIDMKVLAETVYDVFVWCMLHVDDPQIKGDCNVVPKGSAALLIKEQMQQGRQQGMQLVLSNPLVQQLAGMDKIADVLRDYFKGLHFPADFIPQGADLQKAIAKIEQRMANPPPNPAQLQALTHQAHDKSREKIEGAKLAQKTKADQEKNRTAINVANIRRGMSVNPDGGVGYYSGAVPMLPGADQQQQDEDTYSYVPDQALSGAGGSGAPAPDQPGL
jgi:hypothetical protein